MRRTDRRDESQADDRTRKMRDCFHGDEGPRWLRDALGRAARERPGALKMRNPSRCTRARKLVNGEDAKRVRPARAQQIHDCRPGTKNDRRYRRNSGSAGPPSLKCRSDQYLLLARASPANPYISNSIGFFASNSPFGEIMFDLK